MKIDLTEKAAAFCGELDDISFLDVVRQQNMEPVFRRAEECLKSGLIDSELEAALDLLDEMLRRVEGVGLYPAATRGAYQPLPSLPVTSTGAHWWTCPRSQCAGRGRVRPAQDPPVCAATGEHLVPGPLPK